MTENMAKIQEIWLGVLKMKLILVNITDNSTGYVDHIIHKILHVIDAKRD